MFLTNRLRHVDFGSLGVYVRGLVMYRISHYEQKAIGNPLKRIPRTLYRMAETVLFVGPPSAIGYLVHEHTEAKYERLCRKNPEDYAKDR